VLSLEGDIGEGDLNSLCHTLEPLRTLRPDAPVKIDLSGLTSISPTPFSVLVVALRALRSRQVQDPCKGLAPPLDPKVADWLKQPVLEDLVSSRAGRGQNFGGGSPTTRGCEPFTDGYGIDRSVSALRLNLAQHTAWDCSDLASFGAMISDIAENVLQHSEAQGGVAAIKADRRRNTVTLSIADYGIGIRGSLAHNPEYRDIGDDKLAIRTALEPGATGDPGSGGGLGLFLARLVVRDNGGTFTVRSGDGSHTEGEETITEKHQANLHGTLIVVEARTDHEFDYDRIEQWLAQPGGVAG
jgi:anti-sigma regulatory factor (Ser/Thr protein kinase)